MGDTARALGMGAQIEYDGTTYTLSGWTEGVKALYEIYLEGYAISKARALRGRMPAEEVAGNDPVDGARRDITAGMYSFGTRLFRESLTCLKHLKKAIHLQIVENHPGVTERLVDEMFDRAIDDVLFAYQQADADPNGKTPAPTSGAGECPPTSSTPSS